MITYQDWSIGWCQRNNWNVSDNNVKSSVIWIVSEGSNALWNPLDTEQVMPGDWDYNTAGVKNYPDMETGYEASIQTINNGYYSSIITAYQQNLPPAVTCNIICNTPWGSQPTPSLVAAVLADFTNYALRPVAGSESTPSPVGDDMPDPVKYPGLYIRWCYRFLLHREVDPQAYSNDSTFLANGGTPEQLFVNIQDSDEGAKVIAGERKLVGM